MDTPLRVMRLENSSEIKKNSTLERNKIMDDRTSITANSHINRRIR